ncbi:MAG: HigA family addiction module antidote protein [Spirochaetes bacterium]|nr:HigA family addiction module antidote protein [Spirochaetota bacterium]
MKRIKNIHPGEVLQEEFLTPSGISSYKLAKETGMPITRIMDVIHGKRGVSADTAIRLAAYFGNTPTFWLGLQNDYDLEEEMREKVGLYRKIHRATLQEALS